MNYSSYKKPNEPNQKLEDDQILPVPKKNIACQALLSSGSVMYKGHLRRRRKLEKITEQLGAAIKWSPNYAVMGKGCLYSYNSETDQKPCKCWSLYGFTDVQPCEEEVPCHITWPFKVVHGIDSKYSIFFSSASKENRETWMKLLREEINSVNRFKNAHRPMKELSMKELSMKQRPSQESLQAYSNRQSSSSESGYEDIYETGVPEETKQGKKGKEKVKPEIRAELNEDVKPEVVKPEVVKPEIVEPEINDETPEVKEERPPRQTMPIVKPKPKVLKTAEVKPELQRKIQIVYREPSKVEENSEYEPVEVQPRNVQTEKKTLASLAYWTGDASKCDVVLRDMPQGTYVLRDSRDASSKNVLVVQMGASISKFKIQESKPDGLYLNWSESKFGNLEQLLEHYTNNVLPGKNVKLTQPYSTVAN